MRIRRHSLLLVALLLALAAALGLRLSGWWPDRWLAGGTGLDGGLVLVTPGDGDLAGVYEPPGQGLEVPEGPGPAPSAGRRGVPRPPVVGGPPAGAGPPPGVAGEGTAPGMGSPGSGSLPGPAGPTTGGTPSNPDWMTGQDGPAGHSDEVAGEAADPGIEDAVMALDPELPAGFGPGDFVAGSAFSSSGSRAQGGQGSSGLSVPGPTGGDPPDTAGDPGSPSADSPSPPATPVAEPLRPGWEIAVLIVLGVTVAGRKLKPAYRP